MHSNSTLKMKKNILAIVGSASAQSANLQLVRHLQNITDNDFNIQIFDQLKTLPHFDPELSTHNPPNEIIDFRNAIQNADGIIICTPEYVFSIPSGLKNAIEWCIATTVFSDKPTGLITASANGEKGHEELQMIMKTAMANFTEKTTLLVSGIKGKINSNGNISDKKVFEAIDNFISEFKQLLQ